MSKKIIKTHRVIRYKLLALVLLAFMLSLAFCNVAQCNSEKYYENKDYSENNLSSANYASDKITIRFYTSPQLELVARNKPIPELVSIIGEYTSFRYVEDNLLFDNKKDYSEKLQDESSPYSRLYRTYVVELQGEFDIPLLLEKLNTLPFIEYTDIIPLISFHSTTNDPRLSEQYHLNAINAFEAWDLVDSKDSVIVAIIDTGIDDTHPDLKDNIFINQGETGTDTNGNDKSNNGIDDDENGFIDDWRGWNFSLVKTDTTGNNKPTPDNNHGTHVAGICGAVPNNGIGIAGVGKNIKLLNLQIVDANSKQTFAYLAHRAMLYAAKMGAKVINCSWGARSNISSRGEVIKLIAREYNTLVVCAAGNIASEKDNYPSDFKECISVASSNRYNEPSYFTSFGNEVDIIAPGEDILSTVFNGQYEEASGTSMASPVVAGVAALVALKYPDYGYEEIKSLLYKTANKAISDSAFDYYGKIGTGLVDAKAALSCKVHKYFLVDTFALIPPKYDLTFPVGSKLSVVYNAKNIFCDLVNVEVRVQIKGKDAENYFDATSYSQKIDKVAKKEVLKQNKLPICKIKAPLPTNYSIKLEISFWHEGEMLNSKEIIRVLNPDYLTVYSNPFGVGLTTSGTIGSIDPLYKDFGLGINYRGAFSFPVLEECSFLLANVDENIEGGYELWDAARNSPAERNTDFESIKAPEKDKNDNIVWGRVLYRNKAEKDLSSKFEIRQTIVLPKYKKEPNQSYLIVEYHIKNISNNSYDSLYAGMFQYYAREYDKLEYDEERDYYYTDPFPEFTYRYNVGTKLLTDSDKRAKTLDFSISKNLSDAVKIQAITTKKDDLTLQKEEKRLSSIISAGAFSLKPNESKTIRYGIVCSQNKDGLNKSVDSLKSLIFHLNKLNANSSKVEEQANSAYYANGRVKISTDFAENHIFDILLYDINGKLVKRIAEDALFPQATYNTEFELGDVTSGIYFVILRNANNKLYLKIITN